MPETNPQPCVCAHKLVEHRHFGQCEARIIYSQCPCGYYRPHQPIEPTGGVAETMRLHGMFPPTRVGLEAELEAGTVAKNATVAPAPAGWPSDEAVSDTIFESGQELLTKGASARPGIGLAILKNQTAAVQRLYAPLRERLAALTPEAIGNMIEAADCIDDAAKAIHAALQGGSHDGA